MNKSTLAGAAMIAVAAVTVPAVVAWSQSPPSAPPAGAGAMAPGASGGPAREGMMGDGMMREGMEHMMRESMEHPGWGRWARDVSPQKACVERLARRAGFVASVGFKLNLTDQQKPLWDKVLAATQTAQADQRKLCDALPASAQDRGKETVIDRMNHRQQMLQAQLQGLQQTEPAVQALYQSLTPDQKAVLDHPFRRG